MQNRFGQELNMFQAVKENNIPLVKELLDAKANIHKRDDMDRSMLDVAAALGCEEIASMLIAAKAEINGRCPPLCYAILGRNEKIIRQILDAKASIETLETGACEETPLGFSLSYDNEEGVRVLLAAKANIEAICRDGLTPLAFAVKNNLEKMVGMLLTAKANIFAKDEWNRTALEHAASSAIKNLLESAIHYQKAAALSAGLHSRCGKESPLLRVSRHSLFDRQVLRLLFDLSSNRPRNGKKRSRSPSS